MKRLDEILINVPVLQVIGRTSNPVSDIHFDSRRVSKDSLFVAIKGTRTDGHGFINQAIEKGAMTIVCETLPEKLSEKTTYVLTPHSSHSLGMLSANFFDNPSSVLKLIGITGTNGKTTVATLLYQLFRELDQKTGLLSTINNKILNKHIEATHTTPDSIQINRLLHDMVHQSCRFCFMEVSSHAIDQERIAGLGFTGGVFTNISPEHLDYHETYRNYIQTKKRFFDGLPASAFALVNNDDRTGKMMLQNCRAGKKTYALKSMADFKAKVLESHLEGMLLKINNHEIWTRFMGDFNAYNILAVFAVACLLGQNPERVLSIISELKPVSGRLEIMRTKSGITAIIDYAHTPDALKNALFAINKIRNDRNKVITVVGAGGDRDKTKRPWMARVALENSNNVILTSDNPRNEDPEKIIKEMLSGIKKSKTARVLTIVDRAEAIKTAMLMADHGDIVLVAGKGHETYQEIAGKKYHFNDKEIIRNLTELID